MATKRQRGCNYTNEEVAKLLELVEQYCTSIEDKRTGAIYLRQKREAWDKICHAYNAVATSGVRTVEQLRVLYDNKKQKARKALATHNKNEYLKNNVVSTYNITETQLRDAIQHATNDKGQCSKTGGGSWCPTVTESDQKILELLKDQVTPLPNEFDSAATFFGDISINAMDSEAYSENVVVIENVVQSDIHEADLSLKLDATPKCAKTPNIAKRRQNATTPRRPKGRKQINYKQLYFKRKSQNAYLERRRIYQEIRLRQKEHNMLMKEHQIKLQHMEEEHKLKMNK